MGHKKFEYFHTLKSKVAEINVKVNIGTNFDTF